MSFTSLTQQIEKTAALTRISGNCTLLIFNHAVYCFSQKCLFTAVASKFLSSANANNFPLRLPINDTYKSYLRNFNSEKIAN